MMEINSLSKLLLSLYVIQKVTSIEVDSEYVNCTPFKRSENRITPTIHNELLDQVANRSLSTIDMNNLISNDQLANMAHIYAEDCNGRTETADFKNDEMINWIIFVPIISIISVILFMRNGSSIGFICFLVFFYIRLPLIVAHDKLIELSRHSEFDHDHAVDEFIGEGDTIETIFGKHLHYKYTSDGTMMINDCEVIGKLGHGLAGDFKRWADMDLPHRRLNPYSAIGSWPNGDVCYEIDIHINSWDFTLWNRVVNEYSTKTGINLIGKGTSGSCETPSNWIRIYEGTGCWSYVGQVSNTYTGIWENGSYVGQPLSLANGCQYFTTMVHELGHAIGMEHTQTRSDRDDWVIIHWDNIQAGKESNFQMSTNPIAFCYDCTSVMHWGEYSFAIDSSKPTITAKDPTQCTIARNPTSPLSVNDVDVIELLYPTGAPTINPVDCPTLSPTAPTQPTATTLKPTKSPLAIGIPLCITMTNFDQTGGVSADLNGDYTYAGDDGNGYPYYTNDDSGTTYYIQHNPLLNAGNGGIWTIHDDASETLPDGVCFDASLDNCLGTGKWYTKPVSGYSYSPDLNSNLAYCPTTSTPTTSSPTTSNPTTFNPTTNTPTTSVPTTKNPTTATPTTSIPTTRNPTTATPTTSIPTTANPTTTTPTTYSPTTTAPTTFNPTTNTPTTTNPTTNQPTTYVPTTNNPTTNVPTTYSPTTSNPTTFNPTTNTPTTSNPTTSNPTTNTPTTNMPTTSQPTAVNPTTNQPTTNAPTTNNPTTNVPTTYNPTTNMPTTNAPTTNNPTTYTPTTAIPTTSIPTTTSPTTAVPTTMAPTTNNPTTSLPTTSVPTTAVPTTSIPTTINPTPIIPTTAIPTTMVPTTNNPTTNVPTTTNPTTFTPTTSDPTSASPTTSNPTTATEACPMERLGDKCRHSGECPSCMKCCLNRHMCEMWDATPMPKAVGESMSHMMNDMNHISGINNKPKANDSNMVGFILFVGLIAFILINNLFICCWCLNKNKGNKNKDKYEGYEKCDIVAINGRE